MAKKTKTLQDYLDRLENSGQFTDPMTGNFDEQKAKEHMRARIREIEAQIKAWDELTFAIKSHYKELDRVSNKKYQLFNVKTFKEDMDNAEKQYSNLYANLEKESKKFNAKWGKATKEQIEANYNEWLKDNNKLVGMQKRSLEEVEKLAAKAMDNFRNGLNVFDRMTPHIEAFFKGMVKGVNEVKTGMSKMWGSYSSWVEPWAKANQAAANFSKNVGLGAAGMQNLLAETIRFANQSQIGIKYNKSLEEMIKLQQEYANVIGRNVGLTDSYKESLAAMSAVMGDQKTTDITGKLENFGINPDEVSRRMGKMFADASKKGIAFSKYSENFANNIKLAQSYTFANGVRGVASMAEKATKLKLEMQSVAQFANKVNNVEGAVTTGAKLQVLGGAFSQFADPLQMLYEGTSDAEGLQDRIINMFGNLGKFNRLTGEVEVSAFDRQRINAAGEAIGVNPSELMDMIHAKGKRNEIANQMRGLGYSDDLQELIMNTATFDENGNAGVSINGQFVGVDQLAGREQELISLNQSESEDIKEIATTLRGWDDTMQGFKKQIDAKQASWVQKSGLGTLGMQAVQYLGQANWALNTIVGVLTAGKAIGFGMGAYGTAGGATRTIAGAFQNARFNNWLKRHGLYGKDLKKSQRVVGKNIGVILPPDFSGNRSSGKGGTDFNSLILDEHRSQGSDLGINTGTMDINSGRQKRNYIPTGGGGTSGGNSNPANPVATGGGSGSGSNGTPNVNPVATGGGSSNNGNPMDMGGGTSGGANPVATGGGSGTPNVNPVDMGENHSQGQTNIAQGNTSQGQTGVVEGGKTKGRSKKNIESNSFSFPDPGNKLNSNEVLTLQNGSKVKLSDFEVDPNNPNRAINKSTGQRITLDRNGTWRLYENGKKGYTSLGMTNPEDGTLITNNRNVTNVGVSRTDRLRQVGSQTWQNMKTGLMQTGGYMMSAGLSMGANVLESQRQKKVADGRIEENSDKDWNMKIGSKAMSWAGTGASMGAMIGNFIPVPGGALIGAGIGAAIGGIAGMASGSIEKKRTKERTDLMNKISQYRNGQHLTGNYSNEQLRRIARFVETNDHSQITNADLNALQNNGNDYNIVVRKKMANGGLLLGPSHANGGIAVGNSGIELEGGEFIVNKKSTVRNIGLLKNINSGVNIQPQPLNTNSMSVSPSVSSPHISNVGPTEISLKPLDINVNGTIKLDAGKAGNIDISKMILENPQLLRNITEMIEKQININTNGAYNKEKSLNKWN